MKTIYLSGPMLACTDQESNSWRQFVKKELEGLFEFQDPMEFEVKETGNVDTMARQIVEMDVRALTKSDFILANCWKASPGTAMELVYAKVQKKEIISVNTINSPWIHFHSTLVYPTLEEAVQALKEIGLELQGMSN